MTTLKVFFKPDNYPDWVFWKRFDDVFQMIGQPGELDIAGLPSARAGFFPRVSFSKPNNACDTEETIRRLRRGYHFQVRLVGLGHARIDRFRLHGQTLIESSRAKTVC
jgi:hypothetical protein